MRTYAGTVNILTSSSTRHSIQRRSTIAGRLPAASPSWPRPGQSGTVSNQSQAALVLLFLLVCSPPRMASSRAHSVVRMEVCRSMTLIKGHLERGMRWPLSARSGHRVWPTSGPAHSLNGLSSYVGGGVRIASALRRFRGPRRDPSGSNVSHKAGLAGCDARFKLKPLRVVPTVLSAKWNGRVQEQAFQT